MYTYAALAVALVRGSVRVAWEVYIAESDVC